MHLLVYISVLARYCMGISLLVRPVDQQRRQLAERFYSMWYCETSGVDVLARRSRLASKRYTVCESVNVKVCQVIINNGLFEETNQQSSLTKVFYMCFEFLVYNLEWKLLQWKSSPHRKYIIIGKQKEKILWFHVCNKLHTFKLTYVCACTCACNSTHLREQCEAGENLRSPKAW